MLRVIIDLSGFSNEPAILIYHITNKYDGEDEDRLEPFIAGWPYERRAK